MHTRRVVAATVFAVAVGACGPGRERGATPATADPVPPTSPTTGMGAPAPVPATFAPPGISAEAAHVASRYASAQFSYRYDTGPDAWVDAVATLCTPAWLEALRSEPASPDGWEGVVQRREVASAAVVAVHPGRSRVGGQRAVVVVQVTTEGSVPSSRVVVIEVELVRQGGNWLVAGS